ncbi:hypothetical protein FOS14_01430 [Skermania sp. ID1734]|uniref:hypothetical protein n=1 Tax=Skermania sp. ID1734 TaxID=2597516 RepID=UPI00117C89BA|nr:hypothetical protein [Skermania sp. ID1734]TSE02073.1 hypothetical protein FOS14_01430 [Skermania sp. ID1734]
MDNTDNTQTTQRNRPSAMLLISGLVALVVSAWTMLGAPRIHGLHVFPLGWVVLGAALLVGVLLVCWRPKK